MKFLEATKKVMAFLRVPGVIHAHCDIPCGLYDPHAAQFAALTVVRMNQLIQELAKPAPPTPLPMGGSSTATMGGNRFPIPEIVTTPTKIP